MAVGDDALNGKREHIDIHTFPATDHQRSIWFEGSQIRIAKEGYQVPNEDPQEVLKNDVESGRSFNVPAGYECYVSSCYTYFEK
jgi:hypothetical protein